MPGDGWQNIEFTASDELCEFLDKWKDEHGLKTRAAAARDLLQLKKAELEARKKDPPASSSQVAALEKRIREFEQRVDQDYQDWLRSRGQPPRGKGN